MNNFSFKVFGFFISLFLVFFAVDFAYASYQKIAPGDTVTLGEFVFDDDFVATTTACTVGITNPLNVEIVASTTPMTANNDGWHYYNYTTAGDAPSGVWPSVMICGSVQRGDLVKVDKSFIVDWSVVSTSTIKGVVDESLTVATSSLSAVINAHTDTQAAGIISAVNLVTESASSSLPSTIWSFTGRTLDSFGTLVADIALAVWTSLSRTLTGAGLDSGSLATQYYIDTATSTITTNIGTANSSIGSLIGGTNTLISAVSSSIASAQQAGWTVLMSSVDRIQIGENYKAKVYVTNYKSVPTSPFVAPKISLYNDNGSQIVYSVPMTASSTGIYSYSFEIPDLAEGLWEAEVETEVEEDKIITTNDYFQIEGSPPQVTMGDILDDTIEDITFPVTITNEGNADYEYHFEWCVVTDINNVCDGVNDVFYGHDSKLILVGESYSPNLTAENVTSAGAYFFKVNVHYGAEESGATRSFIATESAVVITPTCGNGTCSSSETCSSCPADCGACASGGGGGGGGGISTPTISQAQTTIGSISLKSGQAATVSATTNKGSKITLSIPSGVLTSPSTVTVSPLSSSQSGVPSVTGNVGQSLVSSMVYQIDSSNGQNTFDQPLIISLTYTDSQIVGLSENSLKLFWFDTVKNKWSSLPSIVNASANTISASVGHFSYFALFGQPEISNAVCSGADLNRDKKINSVDFSILMYFWKTAWPFKNSCVDLNNDKKVNSTDFSILMYQWGSKK